MKGRVWIWISREDKMFMPQDNAAKARKVKMKKACAILQEQATLRS